MANFVNFTHLTSGHFYRVRTLQEIAAVNAIGCLYVSNIYDTTLELFEKLLQTDLTYRVVEKAKCLIGPVQGVVDSFFLEYYMFDSARLVRFILKHGLHWTWCGLIDDKTMAQLIVNEELLPVEKRFEVACNNCMLVDLCSLWLRVPKVGIDYAENGSELVKYWVAMLKGELASLIQGTAYQNEKEYGMSLALNSGNLSSIGYFWNQFDEVQRSSNRNEFSKKSFVTKPSNRVYLRLHLVPFFLLEMNAEQQIQLIRDELLTLKSSNTLTYLLYAPWHDLFIAMFDIVHSSLTTADVIKIFEAGCLDLLAWALFLIGKYEFAQSTEFAVLHIWKAIPKIQQLTFLDASTFSENLVYLFRSESKVCLTAILSGVGEDVLKAISHCDGFCKFICDTLKSNGFDLVRLAVEHVLPQNLLASRKFEFKVSSYLSKVYDVESDKSEEHQLKDMRMSRIMIRLEDILDEFLETSSVK